MIQRIQTIFLALVLILSLVFVSGSLYRQSNPEGKEIAIRFSDIDASHSANAGETDIIMLAFSVLIPLLSSVSVFLFRKRKIQAAIIGSAIVSDIIVGVVLAFHIFHRTGNGFSAPVPGIRSIIPLVNLVLLILAVRAVLKDENLVRSYDRLR